MLRLFKGLLALTILHALLTIPQEVRGGLFVASRNTNSILQYDGSTGAFVGTFVTPGSGGLSLPEDLTFGPDRNLYVSGFADHAIHKYDGNTGASLNSLTVNTESLRGLTFGSDNLLYVLTSNAVLRYDALTNSGLATFASTGLGNAQYMVFGPSGDLYVTDASGAGGGVRRYSASSGNLLGTFVPTGSGGLSGEPEGLAFGPDGNLYVSDELTNEVLRYNGSTGAFIDAFVSSIGSPNQIAFGPDGNLYVTSKTSNAIYRFDGATGNPLGTFIAAGSGGLNRPESLTFAAVPEPSTFVLITVGLMSPIVAALRNRRASSAMGARPL